MYNSQKISMSWRVCMPHLIARLMLSCLLFVFFFLNLSVTTTSSFSSLPERFDPKEFEPFHTSANIDGNRAYGCWTKVGIKLTRYVFNKDRPNFLLFLVGICKCIGTRTGITKKKNRFKILYIIFALVSRNTLIALYPLDVSVLLFNSSSTCVYFLTRK